MPQIGGNEWKYVKECLDTTMVSSVGSFVNRFEGEMAAYVGTDYAVATVNGTAALHIALLVAGVEAGDEVLVSTLSFIAPANAVRYIGAWPVFMDADPIYWQMDPVKVQQFLNRDCEWKDSQLVNKLTGRRVKAVLPVHILGHPCDMEPILEVARKHGLAVVEDATESLGATYQGNMVGHLGDIACLSFNGNKLITTGGGGMIVTDNQEWAERAHYLTTQAKDDPIEYFHSEIGYNYRLSNIQAAMGVAQLENIEDYLSRKRAIASMYQRSLQDIEGITLMPAQPHTDPVYWLYTILLHEETTREQRQTVLSSLDESGIGVRPLWHPLHGLPPYSDCQSYKIEHAVSMYERSISLPSSVGLTRHDQERTIFSLRERISP